MDDARKIAEKRRKQIEAFGKNGMFIPRDLLTIVKAVVEEKRMSRESLQILGDTLGNGVETKDPVLNIGIKINLPTVQEYDMFWTAVHAKRRRVSAGKERE